jgi:hypothetical protein
MKKTVLSMVLAVFVLGVGCKGQESSSSDPASKAYETCVEQVMKEGDEKNPGKLPPEVNRQLAEAACKIVKTECAKDPDGPVCQALLKKYGAPD